MTPSLDRLLLTKTESDSIRVSPGEIKRREYVVLDFQESGPAARDFQEQGGGAGLRKLDNESFAASVVLLHQPLYRPPLLMTVSLCECPTQPS